MKNFHFALCIGLFSNVNLAIGSETGMPQLNPEFWTAQIFWLIIVFTSLYLIIWKIFLPKISNSIENRKLKIINDLNETQKLKESAEKKLDDYNKIIEDSKREAKKIIERDKKKLITDINKKKQDFNDEIEKELLNTESEIKNLKKTSISNINKIAAEVSKELVKKMIGSEINMSNVSAIVEDISKRKIEGFK